MAHKKAGSSSKNGRDSVGQRLGCKAGDGQFVTAGSIIVRQRGMTFKAGAGAGLATTTASSRRSTAPCTMSTRPPEEANSNRSPGWRVACATTLRHGTGRRPRHRRPPAESPCGRRLGVTNEAEHPPQVSAGHRPLRSCKTVFEVGSTRSELRVDVCSSCHPFFTGKQTIIDTAGQVERFQRRLERAERA